MKVFTIPNVHYKYCCRDDGICLIDLWTGLRLPRAVALARNEKKEPEINRLASSRLSSRAVTTVTVV